jgi:drug/metabolite transporter (DMT)-like permease
MRELATPGSDLLRRPDPAYAQGVVLVLLAGTCWSLGGLLVRLIEAATAWQIVFFRSVALTLTLLVIIGLRHRGRLGPAFAGVGLHGLLAGAALAGGSIGFVVALYHTTVANAVFMLGTAPLLAALLAWWFLGERVRGPTWLAMALALCGLVLLVWSGLVLGALTGSLIALGMSVCFAIFSVMVRRGRDADMMPCTAYAGMIGAVVGLAMMLATVELGALLPSPRDLALCALMGVLQVGLGLTLFTLGARHLPAAELTLLSTVEIVLGPIWVWLVLGETPGAYTMAGGAIIILALAYQALAGLRRHG